MTTQRCSFCQKPITTADAGICDECIRLAHAPENRDRGLQVGQSCTLLGGAARYRVTVVGFDAERSDWPIVEGPDLPLPVVTNPRWLRRAAGTPQPCDLPLFAGL